MAQQTETDTDDDDIEIDQIDETDTHMLGRAFDTDTYYVVSKAKDKLHEYKTTEHDTPAQAMLWFRKGVFEEKEETPKCLYHKTCGNDADYKTMNGKIDGNKSENWGELAYGNNHLYNWNLCGICFKEECGEDDEEEEDE